MTNFPIIMAMHILANMQKNIIEDKSDKYWELCKKLCGIEHTQWIIEHKFPKEVINHKLF